MIAVAPLAIAAVVYLMLRKGTGNNAGSPDGMRWPLDELFITDGFHSEERPDHTGVDLRAAVGTDVLAPFDGRVTQVLTTERGGLQQIALLDNGLEIGFAHLSQADPVGTIFSRSDVIAKTGNSGLTTGPHLHYRIKENGIFVNPALYAPWIS